MRCEVQLRNEGKHFLYTQYVNRLHGRSGHLWQNRFYSCALDDARVFDVLGYVELNPVRAGMEKKAWEYGWSSAAAHCGMGGAGNPCLDLTAWQKQISAKDWRATLKEILRNKEATESIRRSTHNGRPLGSDRFMSKVERLLGRRVRPLPIGRPKGWRKAREHNKR